MEREMEMGRESVEVDKLAVKGDAGMEKRVGAERKTEMEKRVGAEDDIERDMERDMEKGEGLEKELSELEEENERLRRENELLKEYRASLPLKERLYDRVPLTVKQLDIIIGVLLAGLVFVVALGLLDR